VLDPYQTQAWGRCNPGLTAYAAVHNHSFMLLMAEARPGGDSPEMPWPWHLQWEIPSLVLLQKKPIELVLENTCFWRSFQGWASPGYLTFQHFASVCESSRFFLLKGEEKQVIHLLLKQVPKGGGMETCVGCLSSREHRERLSLLRTSRFLM